MNQRSRRPKGEGGLHQITRAGRKLWQATQLESVEVITSDRQTKTIKKKVSGTGETEREARLRLRANVAKFHQQPVEQRAGNRRNPETVSSYYYNTYLGSALVRGWRSHSLTGVKQRMEQHVLPVIGSIPLADLSKKNILDLFEVSLFQKGLGESSQVNVWVNLQTMLNHAKNRDVIARNPMDAIDRKDRPQKKAPARVEIPPRLVSTVQKQVKGTPDEPLRMVSLLYGLRVAELIGLTWDVVHMDERMSLAIEQQLKPVSIQHGEGCLRGAAGKYACGATPANCPKHVTPQKAGQAIHPYTKTKPRQVPLVEPITTLLKEQKARQDEWKLTEEWSPAEGPKMDDLVFTTPEGKPLRQQSVGRQWGELLEACGLPPLAPHKSRHIAVTALILNNTPLAVISAIVGHADSQITEQIYTQVGRRDMREHLEKIGLPYDRQKLKDEAEQKEKTWLASFKAEAEEHARELEESGQFGEEWLASLKE